MKLLETKYKRLETKAIIVPLIHKSVPIGKH